MKNAWRIDVDEWVTRKSKNNKKWEKNALQVDANVGGLRKNTS